MFNKLAPLVGLIVLAGPVLAAAAPAAGDSSTATSSTATSSTAQAKKTHKHSHSKKAAKPAQTKS